MPCALKISEASSLAMHALGYLANSEDGPITSREIARRFEISEAHLAKVLKAGVDLGVQVLLTGTELAPAVKSYEGRYTVFHVKQGAIVNPD